MGSALTSVLLFIQVIVAMLMVGLILLQHGKGADAGAAFGSGASGSLFGASGGANFMSRTTAILAAIFFACTLILTYVGQLRPSGSGSVLEGGAATTPAAPAAPLTSSPAVGGVPVAPAASTNAVPSAAPAAVPSVPSAPVAAPQGKSAP